MFEVSAQIKRQLLKDDDVEGIGADFLCYLVGREARYDHGFDRCTRASESLELKKANGITEKAAAAKFV